MCKNSPPWQNTEKTTEYKLLYSESSISICCICVKVSGARKIKTDTGSQTSVSLIKGWRSSHVWGRTPLVFNFSTWLHLSAMTLRSNRPKPKPVPPTGKRWDTVKKKKKSLDLVKWVWWQKKIVKSKKEKKLKASTMRGGTEYSKFSIKMISCCVTEEYNRHLPVLIIKWHFAREGH